MTNEARTYGSVLNETARSSSMQGIIGLVLLLGVSYTFNAMDRQVFRALLARILADYGVTLPQDGFASTVFAVNVAIFAALSGWFMAKFGRRYVLLGGLLGYSPFTRQCHASQAPILHQLLRTRAFGLMVSGLLFTRFMPVVQRSVHPSQIGYAGAVALAAFYLPGPFAGYLFGELVEIFGWWSASLFMVAGPPLIGVGLMDLCDHSMARND